MSRASPLSWPIPLQHGRLIKRYKRFFCDLEYESPLGTQRIVAHVPNTGSLKGVLLPSEQGQGALFSFSDDPSRKLKATLHFLKCSESSTWVGINTQLPNLWVEQAFKLNLISTWRSLSHIQREFKLNRSTRLDLLLTTKTPMQTESRASSSRFLSLKELRPEECRLVEIKNVTMKTKEGVAAFPDCVTSRGTKHLRELIRLQKSGFQAEILFLIQRDDVYGFSPARDIDPEYCDTLCLALEAGVTLSTYRAALNKTALKEGRTEIDFRRIST